MTTELIMPILLGFFASSIIGPRLLPLLSKLKFGQFVRDDGPESHLKKQGTPTMGGIIFLLAIVVISLIYVGQDDTILPLMITMIGFGAIGFIDDFLKVVKKQSEGLKSLQKFGLQVIIASGFLAYLILVLKQSTSVIIPFTYGYELDLSIAYGPIMLIVILGTVNGVNLTDGLDGLATSVTSVVSFFFVMISSGIALSQVYDFNGGIFSAIVLGSLLGFLLLNTYPAKVFMGDTGSLALGGYVAAISILTRLPLFILLFGIIYLVETLSVIIQVGYFKKTKKRIFKMAPIHHHFELNGVSETRIVVWFTLITLIMSMIAILAL